MQGPPGLHRASPEAPVASIKRIDDEPHAPRGRSRRRGAVGYSIGAVGPAIGFEGGAGQDAGVRVEAQTAGKGAFEFVGVGPHPAHRLSELNGDAPPDDEGDFIRLEKGQLRCGHPDIDSP